MSNISNRLEYKEYYGVADVNITDGKIEIKTIGLKNNFHTVVTDCSRIKSAFEEMVDNYLEECKQYDIKPEKIESTDTTMCIRLKPELMTQLTVESCILKKSKNSVINMILMERYNKQ